MAIPTEINHEIAEQTNAPQAHPLDPLSIPELQAAVRILTKEKYLGDGIRVASINVIEPAKSLVQKHRPGASV